MQYVMYFLPVLWMMSCFHIMGQIQMHVIGELFTLTHQVARRGRSLLFSSFLVLVCVLLLIFRVIASYLSKVANFNLHHLHLTPPLGLHHLIFAEIFSIRKIRALGYHVALFA